MKMKPYNQFIKEELRPLTDEETYSSLAQTASRKDVLKKSKNEVYHDLEFEVHEMMKKRPDLFCKILKNSKKQVLVEKLDTINFVKDFDKIISLFFNLSKLYNSNDKKYYNIFDMLKCKFHETYDDYEEIIDFFSNFDLDEKEIYNDIVDCEKNCNLINSDNISKIINEKILIHENNFDKIFKFTKNFIHLKLNIYEYFEKFLGDDNITIYTDLHDGNFGYIKGTKDIRCFDPIAININRL